MKNTDDMSSFTVTSKVNEGNKTMWQTTLEPIDAPGDFFSDEVISFVFCVIEMMLVSFNMSRCTP